MEKNYRREVVETLEEEFSELLEGLTAFARSVPAKLLYQNPCGGNLSDDSIGEHILRSAAVVEQVFGGLTANLWDDPFEWTLPETLTTTERIIEYFGEVEATRKRAFSSFADDETLLKDVSVPSGESRRLLSVLLEALGRANNYQGRAAGTLKILSDEAAHRFII